MDVDHSILQTVLSWVATEGAPVLASYGLEYVKPFQKLSATMKLIVSYLITGAIGVGAYMGMMGLLYVPVPVGYISWIETIFAVAFTAIGLPQLLHRIPSLRKQDRIDRIAAKLTDCCEHAK
jgi:hypothetical protein